MFSPYPLGISHPRDKSIALPRHPLLFLFPETTKSFDTTSPTPSDQPPAELIAAELVFMHRRQRYSCERPPSHPPAASTPQKSFAQSSTSPNTVPALPRSQTDDPTDLPDDPVFLWRREATPSKLLSLACFDSRDDPATLSRYSSPLPTLPPWAPTRQGRSKKRRGVADLDAPTQPRSSTVVRPQPPPEYEPPTPPTQIPETPPDSPSPPPPYVDPDAQVPFPDRWRRLGRDSESIAPPCPFDSAPPEDAPV
ncbi:unnamed protein product [Arctogadus glacialis]